MIKILLFTFTLFISIPCFSADHPLTGNYFRPGGLEATLKINELGMITQHKFGMNYGVSYFGISDVEFVDILRNKILIVEEKNKEGESKTKEIILADTFITTGTVSMKNIPVRSGSNLINFITCNNLEVQFEFKLFNVNVPQTGFTVTMTAPLAVEECEVTRTAKKKYLFIGKVLTP